MVRTTMNELEKKLAGWLLEYFHKKLLIHVGDEDEEEPAEEKSGKACAILFTLRFRYLKGCRELWLLNEGGDEGRDRPLTKSEYEEISARNREGGPYDPIYVEIDLRKPEEDEQMITWSLEGGEVVDGTAGGGYEGSIRYDKERREFRWNGPMLQTWIA